MPTVDTITSQRSHAHRPLRIAMVVPPWYELPPSGYGGLEQVCSALVDALVARGHQVTLFGAGTRTGTSANFVSTVADLQQERIGQGLPELVHVGRVNHLIAEEDFDIVHDHTTAGLMSAPMRPVPTVATVHGSPTGELGAYLHSVDRSIAFVAISYAQRRLGPGLPWTATVYNGLAGTGELTEPSKREATKGPVLWLARFSPDKGADLAILACEAAGLPLVLAGKCVEPSERQHFFEVIEPMLAGRDNIKVMINADRRSTREEMLKARCLLLPVRWEEPFGMVMVEAMAAGTPVVALNRGAVPEVVRHGETGLICDHPDELPDALHNVTVMDPDACAEHVRTFFSADLMARRYERVYRRWAATGAPTRVAA